MVEDSIATLSGKLKQAEEKFNGYTERANDYFSILHGSLSTLESTVARFKWMQAASWVAMLLLWIFD